MTLALRGRSFLKELDFTGEELVGLVDLARELKAAKREGREERRLTGKNIALIFEKTSTRTRCAFEVAAADQGAVDDVPRPRRLADRAQGVGQGHRPGARPDVRRHRVPRPRADGGRDPRRVRRRAGVERADRRVAPHPDARRRAHDARAHRQAVSPSSPTATSATRGTTSATRRSSPERCSAWTCACAHRARCGRPSTSSLPRVSDGRAEPARGSS